MLLTPLPCLAPSDWPAYERDNGAVHVLVVVDLDGAPAGRRLNLLVGNAALRAVRSRSRPLGLNAQPFTRSFRRGGHRVSEKSSGRTVKRPILS